MLYKHNKVKQMLRSILPSTRSKAARDDKAASHRANRTNVRQACRKWQSEVSLDDNYDADDSDLVMQLNSFDLKRKSEICYLVSDRRRADKTNHFVRWAEALTADTDDVREKYYSFIGHIGGNTDLIREHAIGHFIDPTYDFREEKYQSWRSGGPVAEIVTREQFGNALTLALSLNKSDVINQQFRNCLFRNRACKEGDPCISKEVIKTRSVDYYILKGKRVRRFSLKEKDRPNIERTVYREHSYTRTDHDRDDCPNMVVLSADNVDRVVKLLYPRSKPAWGFKDGSWGSNRPVAKRVAKSVWKALRAADIVTEVGNG
jgi:hypothetical protein